MPGCRGPALARRARLSAGRTPLAPVFTRAARFSRSCLAHGAPAFRGAAVSAQLRACAGQIETMSPPSRAQALDVIYTREREPCQETHDLCPALIIADGDQVHYMGYFCTWLNLFKGEKNKKMRLSLPANGREWPLADTRGGRQSSRVSGVKKPTPRARPEDHVEIVELPGRAAACRARVRTRRTQGTSPDLQGLLIIVV